MGSIMVRPGSIYGLNRSIHENEGMGSAERKEEAERAVVSQRGGDSPENSDDDIRESGMRLLSDFGDSNRGSEDSF